MAILGRNFETIYREAIKTINNFQHFEFQKRERKKESNLT